MQNAKSEQGKCFVDFSTLHLFLRYAHCDWLLLYNTRSDVMNTTSHRERGSEVAANDFARLRIRPGLVCNKGPLQLGHVTYPTAVVNKRERVTVLRARSART